MPANSENFPVKTVALIVNPIAGMGGAVGLKGTDGIAILNKAIRLGATPIAQKRAELFLSELEPLKEKFRFIAGAGVMGEDEVKRFGFTCEILGNRKKETNAKDTKKIAARISKTKVDLLVFCGGDGTARDILNSIDANLPVLGVPTGVKMHSAVFAVTPQAAARITLEFLGGELPLREAEVMDVDEQAFREGRLSAELHGYVLTPYEPHLIQGNKMASPMTENEMRNQAAIAIYIIENMKPNVTYIVGPGTTTRTIGDLLDEKKTLLGVDLFCNNKISVHDANEQQILNKIQRGRSQIVVTPIGGQGFIFGRGNQQISPKVIRQAGLDNIIVIATADKLKHLKTLKVDTGDPSLDSELRTRPFKVVVDYKTEHTMNVE